MLIAKAQKAVSEMKGTLKDGRERKFSFTLNFIYFGTYTFSALFTLLVICNGLVHSGQYGIMYDVGH